MEIDQLELGNGVLGICPMPGRVGRYQADLTAVLAWRPNLVLTMVTGAELHHAGARGFGEDLQAADVMWLHLPVPDFNAPPEDVVETWPQASARAHLVLAQGGRVLAHCYGGCGRSGMALLRLMVEAGEVPQAALARLRHARPCAVETDGQFQWAAMGAT